MPWQMGQTAQPEITLTKPCMLCYDPTASARSLHVGGPEQPTWGYQNLAQGVWTTGQPWRSPIECIFLLELEHKSLGNNFGNQSEWDTVSSPLLLLKRNVLNTNLKDKSGYCACAVTAFQRNLNGIFFIFYYVPKYIFTEHRLQSTGEEGIKNTLYINMYDM